MNSSICISYRLHEVFSFQIRWLGHKSDVAFPWLQNPVDNFQECVDFERIEERQAWRPIKT